MHGTIGVTSAPQRGRTFWFTARLRATEAPATTTRDSLHAVARRVLVVDDNVVNQTVVEALLKRDAHGVALASDGAQALEAVGAGQFDLVLMDVQMPVMDGIGATRAIHRLHKSVRDIPIITLSANALPEEVGRCYDAGMNDHLSKPIDRGLLRRALSIWAEKFAWGEHSATGRSSTSHASEGA